MVYVICVACLLKASVCGIPERLQAAASLASSEAPELLWKLPSLVVLEFPVMRR